LVIQSSSFFITFGADKIFSTALATIKFLLDYNPMIGFSSLFGTPGLIKFGS